MRSPLRTVRLLALLLLVVLAACGGNQPRASRGSPADEPEVPEGRGLVTENPDGSRTVTSAYGTATVPAEPQRIVSVIGDIDFETLLALGIKPVGAGT